MGLRGRDGSGGAIVVAASDAPSRIKFGADYICNGTADEVQIQAAIDAVIVPTINVLTSQPVSSLWGTIVTPMSGGRVVRLVGTFFVSSPIDLFQKHNVTLDLTNAVIVNVNEEGGNAIECNPTTNAATYFITIIGGVITSTVQDNKVPLSGSGIMLRNTGYTLIQGTHVFGNGKWGIYIDTNFAELSLTEYEGGQENKVILGCFINFNGSDGVGGGIYLGATHETLVSECHIEENWNYNIYSNSVVDLCINNCSIEDKPYAQTDADDHWQVYCVNLEQLTITGGTIEGAVYFDNTGDLDGEGSIKITGLHANTVKLYSNLVRGLFQMTGVNGMQPRQATVASLVMNGCVFNIKSQDEVEANADYIAVSNRLVINGCKLNGVDDDDNYFDIRATADNTQVTFTNNDVFYANRFYFEAAGKSNCSLNFSGNTTRYQRIYFSDFTHVNINGNRASGTPGYTVAGSTACFVNFNNNIMNSYCNFTVYAPTVKVVLNAVGNTMNSYSYIALNNQSTASVFNITGNTILDHSVINNTLTVHKGQISCNNYDSTSSIVNNSTSVDSTVGNVAV